MNTAVFLASSEFLLLVAMQHLVKGRVIVVFPPTTLSSILKKDTDHVLQL